ncbi:pentatricopeptide repeat-containing protein At3g51320-like [Phragmites australis]|uniref:pentatricopeptide repeat-containing protein At3g51320-like n=1 Tax=Phragmites australis TaxID=29695 RepID=UPI002D792113|nr:pentatricopeptide repeat-containing protein At3g51320-like [Phragmites australis]XP_062230492.1 pentatricopeptide repeat-containing protein At3g51320-like [Phragmites australis]XP_062230493.1 pentatricopeptide repeat-containing protein At3g51320-like [Phragmites australis]XP_062230495.1 pentatricopeptide repeat-containing protein At3g51320-like [Phragmites australis]XP_062230496.1 pentatricopeptide repeat-containing protein At3g51320-like [Phragmites australis]XP_062230497.1 pentatricopepti
MAAAAPESAAAAHPDDLYGFLRRGLRTHAAVLRSHAFLLRRGLLLGHPVPAGLLLTASACSAASPPAHILRLLLRHLPPPLPLFSLDAALRALAPRIPFSALLSLFATLLRSHHPLFPDRFSFPPLFSAAASSASPRFHLPSALALHAQLLRRGLLFSPPPHAGNALLHFYAAAGHLPLARHLFDEMPFRDIASCNTMMTAYAGAGGIDTARQLFDGMLLRNAVSWNVIINGYVKAKRPEQALEVVRWMAHIGVRGTATTMVGGATACARLGKLRAGREVHCAFLRRFEDDNLLVWTALVDMYGKCRRVEAARKVFDRLSMRNLVCWNAMIIGHSVYGEPDEGIRLFHEMIRPGNVQPDGVTFIGILCACARLGLLDDGKAYFEQMTTMYSLKLTFAHYWCMANLYGSVGLLEEAEGLLRSVPDELKARALGGLLGLCRFRGEWGLGERIALRLIELEPNNNAHYALLCSVYAAAGRWENAHRVKTMMKERDVRFSPGHRLVNLNEIAHEYRVRERRLENQEIYAILDDLVSGLKLGCRENEQSESGIK